MAPRLEPRTVGRESLVRSWPWSSVLALLPALALLGGCSSPRSQSPPPFPASDLTAVASQSRDDQVLGGRMTITITNTGALPFTVTSVRFESPAFAPAETSARDDLFRPGITYALPVAYGPARCDADPSTATALVEVRRDGAGPQTVRVPVASPDGLLERNHREECAKVELERQIGVLVSHLEPAGDVLRGVMRIERRTAVGPVSLVELRGTALFSIAAAVPARLEADQPFVDVPLTVAVSSCSGHVIGEVKQPYAFSAFLSLGGAPPRHSGTTTEQPDRQAMQDLVRRVCPEAGSTGTVGS